MFDDFRITFESLSLVMALLPCIAVIIFDMGDFFEKLVIFLCFVAVIVLNGIFNDENKLVLYQRKKNNSNGEENDKEI